MQATSPRATQIRGAVEATARAVVTRCEQAQRLRHYSGRALFGVQHDGCHCADPEGQGRRVHKLRALPDLPLLRSALASVPNGVMNFNRILCPVVLSPASQEPLRYAAALASVYSAKLFICHWTGEQSDTPTDGGVVRESLNRLLEDLVNLETGPSDNGQLDWEPLVAEGRNPREAIAAEAVKQEIDLIVMSPKRRPLRTTLLGSTAEQVCRTAPCSVLIAHPDDYDWVASTGHIKLRRVLVAYDFSECADLALRQALSLARRHGAEIHLLHVLTEQGPDSPELRWERHEWIRLNVEKRLRLVVPTGEDQSCKITYTVSEGKAYREVLAYAEREEVDLISIGPRGIRSRMRPLFGSNVDHVLRRSRCPVLVARAIS